MFFFVFFNTRNPHGHERALKEEDVFL